MAAAKQAMPKYRQTEFVVKAYPNSKAAAPQSGGTERVRQGAKANETRKTIFQKENRSGL